MVEHIEIKIGNSETMILKNNILRIKTKVHKKNKTEKLTDAVSDIVVVALVFLILGKSFATILAVESIVKKVASFLA